MKTFSITLPEGDLKEIDEEAAREKRSRNNLIQVIIEAWLDKEREKERVEKGSEVRLRAVP